MGMCCVDNIYHVCNGVDAAINISRLLRRYYTLLLRTSTNPVIGGTIMYHIHDIISYICTYRNITLLFYGMIACTMNIHETSSSDPSIAPQY